MIIIRTLQSDRRWVRICLISKIKHNPNYLLVTSEWFGFTFYIGLYRKLMKKACEHNRKPFQTLDFSLKKCYIVYAIHLNTIVREYYR